MKIFNFVTAIILCLQSWHANANNASPKCEARLAGLLENATNFLNDFKETQNQGKIEIPRITELFTKLFNEEHGFLDASYSTNLSDAQPKLKSFLDDFEGTNAEIMGHINNILAAFGGIGKLAGDFMSNDLTCRPSIFLSRCEAKLNQLRCDLSEFFRNLKIIQDKCQEPFEKLLSSLSKLGELVKAFSSNRYLTTKSEKNYCKLKIEANQFFIDFTETHWDAENAFVALQYYCNVITTLVSTVYVKYNGCN